MDIRFLTPLGSIFALTALVPLAVVVARRHRLREIRRALGLEQPTLGSQLKPVLALVAVPALLAVAAAQPVIQTTRTVRERTDAQAFVVLDISRSMLASAEPGAPTRFERARRVALGLRESLPEVPFGVLSLTDRVLPHLFPTTDARVFAAALARAVDIEQPPPGAFYLTVATHLSSLHSVPEQDYFLPSAKRRVLVVFTDGETEPPAPELARAFKRRPRIETVFVHFWDAGERIYETGVAEGGYRPDPRSEGLLARTASVVGGQVFDEEEAAAAARAVRTAVGEGEVVARKQDSGRLALMPYLTLAALVPLVVVLLSRNLWWARGWPARRRPRAVVGPEGAKVSRARGVAQPG